MRVKVDFDICASSGTCESVAPDLFEVRDDGFLYVLVEEPTGDQQQRARAAEELCPTGAITIED